MDLGCVVRFQDKDGSFCLICPLNYIDCMYLGLFSTVVILQSLTINVKYGQGASLAVPV